MAHVHGAKAMAPAIGAGAATMMTGMGKMGGSMAQSAMEATAVSAAVAVGSIGTFKKLLTHPLVLFGVGVAVGYYAYKYRKEILSSAHAEE